MHAVESQLPCVALNSSADATWADAADSPSNYEFFSDEAADEYMFLTSDYTAGSDYSSDEFLTDVLSESGTPSNDYYSGSDDESLYGGTGTDAGSAGYDSGSTGYDSGSTGYDSGSEHSTAFGSSEQSDSSESSSCESSCIEDDTRLYDLDDMQQWDGNSGVARFGGIETGAFWADDMSLKHEPGTQSKMASWDEFRAHPPPPPVMCIPVLNQAVVASSYVAPAAAAPDLIYCAFCGLDNAKDGCQDAAAKQDPGMAEAAGRGRMCDAKAEPGIGGKTRARRRSSKKERGGIRMGQFLKIYGYRGESLRAANFTSHTRSAGVSPPFHRSLSLFGNSRFSSPPLTISVLIAGPTYCERCADVFRNHLIREKTNSAGCCRAAPCNDCAKVMAHFECQGDELWECFRAGHNISVRKESTEPLYCPYCKLQVISPNAEAAGEVKVEEPEKAAGGKRVRRKGKPRKVQKMGGWLKKYGYSGPDYCQRCSRIFRDHLIRQRRNAAGCSRDAPCVECAQVMSGFLDGGKKTTNPIRCITSVMKSVSASSVRIEFAGSFRQQTLGDVRDGRAVEEAGARRRWRR